MIRTLRRFFRHMFADLDWNDIMERAVWTAIQAGAGAIPSGSLIFGISGWRLALGTAATAGLGFLGSTMKNIAKQKLEEGTTDTTPDAG